MPRGFSVINSATGPQPTSEISSPLQAGLKGMFRVGYSRKAGTGIITVYDYALKYATARDAETALSVLRLSVTQGNARSFAVHALGDHAYGWHVLTPIQGASLPTTYVVWRSGAVLSYIFSLGVQPLSDATSVRLARTAEANIRTS